MDWDDFLLSLWSLFCIALFVVFCGGLIRLANNSSLWEKEIRIEQLRHDLVEMPEESKLCLYNQAVSWNQTIRIAQQRNDAFFVGIFIPNGWDDIELLDVR